MTRRKHTALKNDGETNSSSRFIEAARYLECDESEERFNAALGKIVRHKPKPEALPEKAETSTEKEPAK